MENQEQVVPFDFDNEDLFVVETLQYGAIAIPPVIGGGGSNSNCNCNSCNCSDGGADL